MKCHPPFHPHKNPTEPTKEIGAEYVLVNIVDNILLMADETLTSFITNQDPHKALLIFFPLHTDTSKGRII